MTKITHIIFITFLFAITSVVFAKVKHSGRETLDMNAHWAFYRGDTHQASAVSYNDSSWEAVNIPHVMRIEKKHNGGTVFQGTGWYRRYFRLSQRYLKKRITIQFQGVQTNCEIFLNGKKIAQHSGGYIGFVVDITPHILFDHDNVLAVRVSNRDDAQTPPGKAMNKLDFNYYGGIYRDVKMLITDQTYISDPLEANLVAGGGVLVSFPKVSKDQAIVNCRTHIVTNNFLSSNGILLETSLVDDKGNLVAISKNSAKIEFADSTFVQKLKVLNPKLWHPDQPFRYRLISRVYQKNRLVDELTSWIGIRRFEFRSPAGEADGFYLNGEKLYIRGANRHQAFPYVGDAASNSMQYRDALLLKRGGFNAVRAAHYPPSPTFLDACDSLGLLVIECQPGWQYYSEDPIFVDRTFRDIREMIRRDRNHPSVFLWETSLNESPTPPSWMKKAVQIAHDELPGDQLFTADDLNDRSRSFYDVFYKVINPDGSDPLPKSPSLTREWGDAWFADPHKENGLRASRIYGEKGLITQSILRQNALNGEKNESLGGYWDHAGLDANPRISGYFLWSFNDYTRGYDDVTAFSGVVDLDRYPKFGYYQMKALQDARNPTYGPTVHIASYNARQDLDWTIIVFSNCDKVRLFRNGTLVGEKTREANSVTAPFIYSKGGSPYFQFQLTNYEPGVLKAVGILDGNVVCTHSVETPGRPHHLKIEIADLGISPIAEGSDMIPIYITVCDEKGNLVSSDKQANAFPIEIKVSGKGRLIGVNNASAAISTQYTEGGIAYALIRPTLEKGQIVITAKNKMLISATAEIKTVAGTTVQVPDGRHLVWKNEYEILNLENKNVNLPADTIKSIDLTNTVVLINKTSNNQIKAIFDGNLTTTWQADQVPSIIITLDLEKKIDLDAYRIYWGKDSDWYQYSLELSKDGSNWFTAESHRSSSGQDYSVKKLKQNAVRYLRLTVEGIRPENSKVSLREIELFGKIIK